jgi:hypothetical protein
MDLETGISMARTDTPTRTRAAPPSHDAIRRRAYLLWEREGRPIDHGLANWLEAESELRSDATARVRDLPSAPIEAAPGKGGPYSPDDGSAGGPSPRKTEGPFAMCREAIGNDIHDYAFHLSIKSGCAAAETEESWREARLCIEAHVPQTAGASARRPRDATPPRPRR